MPFLSSLDKSRLQADRSTAAVWVRRHTGCVQLRDLRIHTSETWFGRTDHRRRLSISTLHVRLAPMQARLVYTVWFSRTG